MSRNSKLLHLAALGAAATFGLAACNKPGEPTVGQKVDGAIVDAQQVGQEAKQAGADAVQSAKAGALDATITAKINGALLADDKLSATKINVDTSNGRVTLSGTAPDAASRDRATTLASAVEGVTRVENKLSIKGS